MFSGEDNFCAPATAPVSASLAIVRVNGPGSLEAVKKIFSRPADLKPRRACYGTLADGGHPIDDVVVTFYQRPASFTGDDLVEISCHGNNLIIHRIIRLLNSMGIRLAEPGEFSRRAFLNGKLDLTEAEAINHIINARSEWEVETALKQMHGALGEVIGAIREEVIRLKADIEAGIDFIEEDIEFVSSGESLELCLHIEEELRQLLLRCKTGQKVSRGIDVVITGKPNVGKSSILNLILNQERAIVSDIPGTTRDMIRESVQINGIHLNLVDTAGIDIPGDEIEKIGIELSHRNIKEASLVLCVLDAVTGITEADRAVLQKVRDKQTIYLVNKADVDMERAGEIACELPEGALPFSARTGLGLSRLEQRVTEIMNREFVDYRNSFIADMRVVGLVEKALSGIGSVRELVTREEPPEIVSFEMQALIDTLSEITGEISPDDILESIFSRFCIGK